MAQIKSADELRQYLQEQLAKNPEIYSAAEWPAKFSLMPLKGAPFRMEVTEEGKKPVTYVAALEKGPSGKFDKIALMTEDQYSDIVKKEAIAGVIGPIAAGNHPVTGAKMDTGYTGKQAWFDANNHQVDLGFDVRRVWVDSKTSQVIKIGADTKGFPQQWWVKTPGELKPGTLITSKDHFVPSESGLVLKDVYKTPLSDAGVARMSEQADLYIKAQAQSVNAPVIASVPAALLKDNPLISIKPLPVPEAAKPAAAAPVAQPVSPVTAVVGEPKTQAELRAIADKNDVARIEALKQARFQAIGEAVSPTITTTNAPINAPAMRAEFNKVAPVTTASEPAYVRPAAPVVPGDKPVIQNGSVITVNLGAANGGVHALWQDAAGKYQLVNGEGHLEKIQTFTDNGNALLDEAGARYVKAIGDSFEETSEGQHSGGKVDYDLSTFAKDRIADEIKKIADAANAANSNAIRQAPTTAPDLIKAPGA